MGVVDAQRPSEWSPAQNKGGVQMGFIKSEDVVGYRVEGQIVCEKCVVDHEAYDADEVFTRNGIMSANGYFFCDRCKKQILNQRMAA
jgi:hypothetical protein